MYLLIIHYYCSYIAYSNHALLVNMI